MAELIEANGTMVTCPYCQIPYRTGRRPGPDQNHHCKKPDCINAYYRDYRRGKREQIRKNKNG
jgi:hypothetical protein